jgi:hypothetical protein
MTGRVIDDIIRASEALKDKGLFRAEKGFSRIGVFAGVFGRDREILIWKFFVSLMVAAMREILQ